MLEGYSRATAAIEALDEAFDELKNKGVLITIKKNLITGSRGKIEDVVYTLTASRDFVAHMKAANKRESMNGQKLDNAMDKNKSKARR